MSIIDFAHVHATVRRFNSEILETLSITFIYLYSIAILACVPSQDTADYTKLLPIIFRGLLFPIDFESKSLSEVHRSKSTNSASTSAKVATPPIPKHLKIISNLDTSLKDFTRFRYESD